MLPAILGLAVLVSLSIGAVLWMTSVPGRSHDGPLPPLTPEQMQLATSLRDHVSAIATVPHNTAYPDELERAAGYIEEVLGHAGYEIHRQTFRSGRHDVHNIEVVIEPAAACRDSQTLVVGAHYDSYLHAPGANDNATGVAAVLELARILVDLKARSCIRIRLVLFVNEEPPYFKTEQMGSLVYARRLKQSGESVFGVFSLETIGFYSDDEHSQRYPFP